MTGSLVGTRQLVRLVLRRDRIRLPVWVLGIVALVYFSVGAVQTTYSSPQEVRGYADTMGTSPAAIAMAGPPVALDTVGGIAVNETGFTAFVGVALMALFLVVRHTRGEEEQGRAEVLRSAVLGRQAGLAAALLETALGSVLVGLGVVASVLTLDVPAGGAVLYGAAVVCFGLVSAGVAAVTAQLTEHARGAIGMSLAVLAAAFLLRAVGDVQDNGLSWVSPMGWSQQVTAFGEPRWWPLLISLAFTALAVAGAVELSTRRDLGAGIVPPRPGPARAVDRIGTPVGLAWRLQRGALIGWVVGVFIGAASFGSFSREVTTMVESNPELADFFARSGADLVESFLASALLIMNLIGAGFAASSALRLRSEETSGRLEPVLATAVSRSRWMLSGLLVTLVGTVLVVAAGGLGVGIAHGTVTGDAGQVGRMLGYSLTYLPAVLVLSAVAAVLFGWLPRLVAVAWAVLAVVFVIGYFGDLFDFPGWVRDVSPFTHTPLVPVEGVSVLPVAAVTLVVILLVAAGLAGFRRRDVTTG
jgi:ABC-2 type transport system permease protein